MIKTHNIITATVVTVVLVMAAAVLSACSIKIEKSKSGVEGKRTYDMKNFKGITVASGVEVIYTVSKTFSVKAVGDELQLSHLDVFVSRDSILVIGKEKHRQGGVKIPIRDNSGVKVYVSSPSISSASVSGSGVVKSSSMIHTPTFFTSITGSGVIELDGLNVEDKLNAYISGSGCIELDHIKAVSTYFSIAGSGYVDAKMANVSDTEAQIAGAGAMDLEFSNCNKAVVGIAGSGGITLKGTLHELDKNVRGSGDIDTDNLILK